MDFQEKTDPISQAAIGGIKLALGPEYESNIEIMREFVCKT